MADAEIDSSASFPTAQLVAEMRAMDAALPNPKIGSNTGTGPDLCAKVFVDETGKAFAKEWAELTNSEPNEMASAMGARSMWHDGKWMEAVEDGCKQFVILAAGLDGRAWRLDLQEDIKVFELDVPRAMAYKRSKIPNLTMYDMKCQRIEVEADLVDPTWTEKLVSAGFNPEERCFVLMEGLLMYVPEEAIDSLLVKVGSIMSSGSSISSDCYYGDIDFYNNMFGELLKKFCHMLWTYAFPSLLDAAERVTAAGFSDVESLSLRDCMEILNPQEIRTDLSEEDFEKAANEFKDKIMLAVRILNMWPAAAITWLKGHIDSNTTREALKLMCDDASNHHGLRDQPSEMRARVVGLVWEAGFDQMVRDGVAARGDNEETNAPKALCEYGLFFGRKA